MSSNFNFLFQYLEKEKIFIDQSEFEFQIQSHPDYPSLLAMSDTLSFFKIRNLTTKLENQDLVHLPNNFIALIKNEKLESILTAVEKNKKGYKYLDNDVVVEKNEASFLETFQNIVLLAEKEENDIVVPKKSNSLNILGLFLLVIIYFFLIFINSLSIVLGLIVCFASIGVYLSYEAISSEFGIKTKFSEAVCTITTSADCNAVLNAVKSKIIEKIGFSTVSITFFSTQIVCALLFSVFNIPIEFFYINSILLLLSTPIIAFSIYHQILVAKKWCPICMAIIFVILMQLLMLNIGGKFLFIFNTIYFLSYIFLLIGIYLIVYLFKNSYKVNLELKSTIVQNNRFKRNYSLFKMALNASEKLEITTYNSEKIILGNSNANLKIIIVSSPYCGYCKNTHELINEILNRYYDKVCIQYHFNFNIELADLSQKELHFRLLQIYFKFGQNQFIKNMHTWFVSHDINKIDIVDDLEEKEGKLIEILANQHAWNLQNNLTYTPAIIINDFHFPKQYERSDLIYFIEELAHDESFNL